MGVFAGRRDDCWAAAEALGERHCVHPLDGIAGRVLVRIARQLCLCPYDSPVWTNPDPSELERYKELPEPLKLTRYLRLLRSDPTGWVSILRSAEPDNPHSTITCVLVETADVPKILAHPDWSDDELGSSWNSTSRIPGFEDGLSAVRNDYTMHFFAQAQRGRSHYHELKMPLTSQYVII